MLTAITQVVYEWAKGMSFNRIADLTDVMEGKYHSFHQNLIADE